ncbi:MAG: PAS domain-containing sensor histidine kinase [Pirellulaceae bacterium]
MPPIVTSPFMTRHSRDSANTLTDKDALLRLLPEQLPLMIYVCDLVAGRTVYANRRFDEILGYATERPIDLSRLRELVHPDDYPVIESALERYQAVPDHEIVTTTFRIRAADGHWHWLRGRDMIMARLADGSPHLILGSAEDITQQRDAEEKERAYREQIESDQVRLRQLLELNERERRMVAYDVHDGFVQDVVAAQLAIDNMLDRLAQVDPESVAPLLRVRAFVRKSIDEARRVVSELRPATMDDGGLVEAIQFLVNEAEVAHRLDVQFSFPDNFPALSPLLVRALVRIVQEALNNVRRHARTHEANVDLTIHGEQIKLEIRDQGSGFSVAKVPQGRYGLEGMRERARVFSGKLAIYASPGQGTRIVVTVPIEPPPAGTPAPQPVRAPRPSVRNRRSGPGGSSPPKPKS